MSIASAIVAAQEKVEAAYTAVSNKGGTIPETQNLSNLPTAITSIPSGGGSAVIEPLLITPSTSAQTIEAPEGVDGFSPVNVDPVDATIDENIVAGNIKSGVEILGVVGTCPYIPVTISSLDITPTTSAQYITPPAGSMIDGYSPIEVSAVDNTIDANIVAGNIKSGVTILGVTGTYTGAPSGIYREFEVDQSNKIVSSRSGTWKSFPSNATDISDYCFAYAYYYNTNVSGAIDLSSLTQISGTSACNRMFGGCTGITGVDLSSLTAITADNACAGMFAHCTGITGALDLSSLTTVNGINVCNGMFYGCVGITSVDVSSLAEIKGMFALEEIFGGCTGLTSLSFPALTSTSFGASTNQFRDMLKNVTGCTVHFPSNLQSVIGSWSDVVGGFGGTNTTVLFDLTATS